MDASGSATSLSMTAPASPSMKGARSRSAPSLPQYNLRQYSVDRRRLANEHAPVSGTPPQTASNHPLDKIDLVGGNGRWRQKRAKEQWVLDQAEAEKQRRERRILEEEKRRRREEREARRRKQQEEDQQRQRAQEEAKLKARLEQEEREKREEEEARLRKLQEEADWLARQPKTCTTCMGSGKCTNCGGRGCFFSMFLAPSVDKDTLMDYGRAPQGCPECGGCAQNIRGALQMGSGKCITCDGVGKVTPKFEDKPKLRSQMTRANTNVKKVITGSEPISGLLSPVGGGSMSPTNSFSPKSPPRD